MALVSWDESYSVKVQKFDEQHKKLIGIINQLHDAMRSGKGSQVQVDVLMSLATYTQAHFSEEERVMRLHNYPDFVTHKKAHDQLVAQVRNFQREAETDKTVITMGLMIFLKDWLLQHIQGVDFKYGPFMKEKGIA
jgi:hemerythrin